MCTVSWVTANGHTSLCFNRDEQRLRPEAVPPALIENCTPEALAPIDPQGGGTWIFASATGRIACLLNNYDAPTPSGSRFISRGALMLNLARSNPGDVFQWLQESQPLSSYAPHHLLVFDKDNLPVRFDWNGDTLNPIEIPETGMFTTSGWNSQVVTGHRRAIWEGWDRSHHSWQSAFHAYENPEDGGHSVRMRRPDARTVSFSHLQRSNSTLAFSYQPISDEGCTQAATTSELQLAQLR